ncbi:MAG: DUF58 domain-containing protein, partial [Bacteriovorax sp.]|nr:DUF58 domain-containing protein [Bacteriovorax sp.]
MLINLKKDFTKKMATLRREEQLYIVPTFDGLKLLVLNFILLVVGLVYANNYVLLFNFVLFCLFLGSMYYTHFNLQGLKLVSAKISPLYTKSSGILTLQFNTTSSLGHFFLRLKINNAHISVMDPLQMFSFNSSSNSSRSFKIDLPIMGIKRGDYKLNRICIETLFPFHLFRCFVFYDPVIHIVVYPEKKNLNIHDTKLLTEEINNEGDDFILRNFQTGDSLKRVHWKKLAQTNQWFSKNLMTPKASPVLLSLIPEEVNISTENQLSSICFALCELHFQNIPY